MVQVRTPAPSSSGGNSCLEGGYWRAPDGIAYWQTYFEQKTGVTGQLLKVKSGLKSLSFAGGKATIEGRFALTSIPMADDPGGPLISGIGRWDFEGSYHVSPSGLVADTNDIDVFEIKMFLNETPIGAVPRPAGVSGFVPGQTVPFRCVGDRLTIEEPGASGPVSVEYRRVA